MIHVHSYEGICTILTKRFRNDYRRKDVNITGLIFCIPDTPIGKSDFLPIVDFWHYRSDDITDFFCGGFLQPEAFGQIPEDSFEVKEIRHAQWFFSSKLLSGLVAQIESVSSWSPSGGFDVIICTARHTEGEELASLDFSSAVCITLEDAKKTNAVRDLSHLLSMVFEFAKSINEDATDAAWKFSENRGIFVLKKSLKAMLESWIPTWLANAGREAEVFAVRDISPEK